MKTFPLNSLTIEQAISKQFAFVDSISREFEGLELLTRGDLGVHPEANIPQTTRKAEKVIARFFKADDAAFVRGAGTGAIREALASISKSEDKILVHDAPIYSTTITTLSQLNLSVVKCNFNDDSSILKALDDHKDLNLSLIQISRQTLDDSYNLAHVIEILKTRTSMKIVTDDNYAVMKIDKIGVEEGADLSCFSSFKLLGPEGIGIVVGKKAYIDTIHKFHYSGGSQTQGFEALEALRGMCFAPVTHAVQAVECDKIVATLNSGLIKGVESAFVANAQSKVILVKLNQGVAREVLIQAEKFGAAPYPVGAESKYEITPMFYKLSGTMLDSLDEGLTHWIRINPMRSGHDTVLRILKDSIETVVSCF